MSDRVDVFPPRGYSRARRDELVHRYRMGLMSLPQARGLNECIQYEKQIADKNGPGFSGLVLLAAGVAGMLSWMGEAAQATS